MRRAGHPAPRRSTRPELGEAEAVVAASADARRLRADLLLVARGFFESRNRAAAAIAAGLVTADGVAVRKASDMLPTDISLQAQAAHPWVSRGGVKLDFALTHFGFDPSGLNCLDVGASTGGFTDVLLRRGARIVAAVDCGHDQLHGSLRDHSAVRNLEGVDIRALDAGLVPQPVGAVVIDTSFISLRLILPAALGFAPTPAFLVALVKPQFEVGRGGGKKGIVRAPELHEEICRNAVKWVEQCGWRVEGVVASPIAGGDGNREFLLGARLG